MHSRADEGKSKKKGGRAVAAGRQQADNRRTEAQGKQAGCPLAKKCGGCQHSDMPYELQLKKKQKNGLGKQQKKVILKQMHIYVIC